MLESVKHFNPALLFQVSKSPKDYHLTAIRFSSNIPNSSVRGQIYAQIGTAKTPQFAVCQHSPCGSGSRLKHPIETAVSEGSCQNPIVLEVQISTIDLGTVVVPKTAVVRRL